MKIMNKESLKSRLKDKGLKATPRRLSILQAITALDNHPSAEEIVSYLRAHNLNIATATVYKALDILATRKVINKVETESSIIRYDAITEPHHHLISSGSGLITDYENEEISRILNRYFEENKINDFEIEEIKLQITGKFKNDKD
jgi:Fur family peroxide stress response transcriptional regulator